MEIDNERYRALSDARHFYGSETHVPKVLIELLLALVGDSDVVVSTASRQMGDDTTTWRGLWVTDSSIAWAEATGNKDNWNGYNEDPQGYESSPPTEVTLNSWVRPVRNLQEIRVTDLWPGPRRGFRSDNMPPWLFTAGLVFDSSVRATLPLFEGRESGDHESAEACLLHLQKRWSER